VSASALLSLPKLPAARAKSRSIGKIGFSSRNASISLLSSSEIVMEFAARPQVHCAAAAGRSCVRVGVEPREVRAVGEVLAVIEDVAADFGVDLPVERVG
jgi:hypothetical protein